MSKNALFFLWMAAMKLAAQAAKIWTPWTTADDELIANMATPQFYEEFWNWLVSKGWAKSNAVNVTAVKSFVASAPKPDTASGTVNV